MFGLCALSKRINLYVLFFSLFFSSPAVFAQGIFSSPTPSPRAASINLAAQSQKGTIVGEEAQIYQDPDFDAQVIAVLKLGGIYVISKSRKGPFYKIRIKSGVIGWIADTDVRPGIFKVNAENKEEAEAELEEKVETGKPFFATRYRGPVVEFVNYTEETMGKERSSHLPFYGIKWAGFNTLIKGEIYTDSSLLFYSGAPSYYQDLTGKSAEGFILNAQFLFQTVDNISRSVLYYYGFGPVARFSHFSLQLAEAANTNSYAADDLALGAVFDMGIAVRFKKLSLRGDAKYYWEKTKYSAFGINFGWEF